MRKGVWQRSARFLRTRAIGIGLGLLVASVVTPVLAASPAQGSGSGEAIFQAKCAACHTIGKGNLVGPDLKGVTSLRSNAWLTSWIMNPDQLIAQGDPAANELIKQFPVRMPNLGLSAADTEAVITYLAEQSGGAPAAGTTAPAAAPATAPAAALPAGDALQGKDYFDGANRFANGGPPCMACHSIAGLGALGGGGLGPDLTPAFGKFGQAGLASILATIPFPTMQPIFSQHPLTPQEQADLLAFLQQAPVTQRPGEAIGELAVLGVVGMAILLLLANLVWRRRSKGVRKPMLRRQIRSY